MSPEQTKAARYIQLLDDARCDSDWDSVPDLVRKIRKHAPERLCLALAAECEHAVTQASRGRHADTNTLRISDLSHLLSPLSEAIDNEKTYMEDEFQAQVCLGWIYWVSSEPGLACSNLPQSIEQEFAQLDGTGKESAAWTKVCAVKASYIKGVSLIQTGAPEEALETFESALPIVTPPSSNSIDGFPEQEKWTELLLSQFCMLSAHIVKSKSSSKLKTQTLAAFRAWAQFWEQPRSQASSPGGGHVAHSDILRRQVWKEYYCALSSILRQDVPYPVKSLTVAYPDKSTRLQQKAELQRIESIYEGLLLNEVQFPRAEEASEEVEEWADQVMQNWRVLCGSSWHEQNQNHTGREYVSRRVLAILYRAATKTFHSTSILRHLFTVHLAVGEFDIAFKAFDTYLDIVKKGKARVEKTGDTEEGLDSDETVLITASECMRALCRYGSRQAAEKANSLAQYFEDWLKRRESQTTIGGGFVGNGSGRPQNGNTSEVISDIHPESFAIVWRSIGISKAQWARLTFEAGSRPQIQSQAIKSLRRALSPEYGSTNNVDTLFALAMVLAERRDLGAAIDVVKRALLPPPPSLAGESVQHRKHDVYFSREISLIPLWHLLALLLSARQEFTTASRACEGAFEQFKDPKILFGDLRLDGGYRSEHLNMKADKEGASSQNKGLVDDMHEFEKEAILEVKMTQLALIEILEGPDIAVNASDELLSLYTRLFGEPQNKLTAISKTTQTLPPPQSSTGTLRSITGSIFGRSRQSIRRSAATRGRTSPPSEKSSVLMRPQTAQPHTGYEQNAPAIRVTNEDGGSINPPRRHERLHMRSVSLSRKKSHSSMRNRSSSVGPVRTRNRAASAADTIEVDHSRPQGEQSTSRTDTGHLGQNLRISQVGLAISPDIPSAAPSPTPTPGRFREPSATPPQNTPQKQEPLKQDLAAQHESRQPHLSSRFSSLNPATHFPMDQERRRRIGALVRVWLLIAGFYRRAEMYEDAKGAIDEAYKLVLRQELDVSKDESGNVSIEDGGWGSGKSVEELWGDVWSEHGYLSSAQGLPFTALSEFERALTHWRDHPSAIVGLSNILLDIYSEVLTPPSSLPTISPSSPLPTPSQSVLDTSAVTQTPISPVSTKPPSFNSIAGPKPGSRGLPLPILNSRQMNPPSSQPLSSTALLDRLAARDRAYGLLSGLTKLGTGWNYSEAWFALARAHEEAGQLDKARDALWWCVELEEAKGVRDWNYVSPGGYVL